MDLEKNYGIQFVKYNKEATLIKLKEGDIEDLRVSAKLPIDEIVRFGLDQDILQGLLQRFPDKRKCPEVPIEVLLLPQIIQRLNDEHSLVSAPYMLNSADLLVRLGYNAKIMEEGFNNRNIYPRETVFDGTTLKHQLLSIKASEVIQWFNTTVNLKMKEKSTGRSHCYIIDGTKLSIPSHLSEKYEGSSVVKDNNGNYTCGYKAVWIKELVDKKGVIRALKIAPINVHDLVLGKELIEEFEFEEGATLLMDRGFIDYEWITDLNKRKKFILQCLLEKIAKLLFMA
jgi:hypothetical protein